MRTRTGSRFVAGEGTVARKVLLATLVGVAALVLLAPTAALADTAPESAEPSADASEDPANSTAATGPAAAHTAPTLTRSGAPGLNRLQVFPGGETGSIVLGAGGTYFGGSDVVRNGDRVRKLGGWFGLTWRATENVELFGVIHQRAATSTFTDPTLIHSIGNPGFGLRAGGAPAAGFSLAGQLGTYIPSATDSTGLDFGAPRVELLALASLDIEEASGARVPLRLHVNTGPIVDLGRKLFDVDLTRPERFAHEITGYSRWRVGLGVEAALPWVAPYAEYLLDVPLDPFCSNEVPLACVQDEGLSSWPSVLTLGLRGTPAEPLSLHTGIELGLTTRESQGTPAVPAWTWVFGLSWEIDPRAGRHTPLPPEEPAEVVAPPMGRLNVAVVDSFSGAAVPHPRVAVAEEEASDRIGDADGSVRLAPRPAGTPLGLVVRADGWQESSRRVVVEEGETTVEIALDERIAGARLSGRITLASPEAGPPRVQIRNATTLLEADVDDEGSFSLDFEPGTWTVTMSAPGHLSRRNQVRFERGRTHGDLSLRAQPDPGAPRLTADAILFDAEGLRFDGAQPTLDSDPLLRALAALLARHAEIEVLLRVHVDDREDEAFEQALARDRGAVLIEELDLLGVDPTRLQVEAVGAAEPLVPNLSARDRARNNRVELVILPPAE